MNLPTLEPPSLLGYQLRLPSFEGPFDVLLRLIERNQLPITDISLSAVTEQFLDYVAALDVAPPETLAEFAAVGARLVLIKSRSLLPRPAVVEDESPSGDLARQLIEYQAVKAAAHHLASRDASGAGAFARALGAVPVPTATSPRKLAAHEPVSLVRALRRRLAAAPSPRELLHVRPMVSLASVVELVISALSRNGSVRFSRLAAECADGHEIRTAFLAVLILIRRRQIDVDQPEPFGDIFIHQPSIAWRRAGVDLHGQAADD